MADGGQALQAVTLKVMRPAFKALWRMRVSGLDNIPADGGAIICGNHTAVIDSFFLPIVAPRPVSFVGKAEYMDDWKTSKLFPALGMIPIDRSGGDSAQAALDAAAGVLESGNLFGIYPEGTRSRSGFLHKGHTGAARLAVRTGCPIIPVGIKGARRIQPPDQFLPHVFRPLEVSFGKPIYPAASDAISDQRLRLRQMTDEVMFEIRELSGQDYVNEYANKPAAAVASAPAPAPIPEPEMPPRRSSADVLKPIPA
ncbi:MAG: lysophospholipid acyltransferase family protein [Actinomycetota bacterium]